VIEAFSQRRREILARMAELGARSARSAQAATLETRRAKDAQAPSADLRRDWARRGEALGFGAEQVAALLGVAERATPDLAAVAEDLAGPGGLTARASTFTRRDVVRAWCERLDAGASVEEVELLADATLDPAAGIAVALLDPTASGTPEQDGGSVAPVTAGLARHLDHGTLTALQSSPEFAASMATLLAAGWQPAQVGAALLDGELGSADSPDAVLVWRAQRLAGRHGHRDGLGRGAVIRRSDGRTVLADAAERRYSTPELLTLEQRLVDRAVARVAAGVAVVPGEHVDAALARRPSIAGEQAAMVRRLTMSGAGVEVVVGKAGAGKTFALDAAREAWQSAGISVVGAALAARAAGELHSGAGIDSYTIDALLADLDRPRSGGLARGSVLVLDEAGMVGTRKLARLLDHAEAAGAKAVLVGDHRQLPEIDAGGAFRGLLHRIEPVVLAENRRQRHPWERAALDELRTGDPAVAVAAFAEHGSLVVGGTAEGVRERLVEDWWAAYRDAGPAAGVMVAARHSDVDDLNDRARTRLRHAGTLTGPELHAGGRVFQAGDRVVTLHNDRRLGVVNGTRATVTAVETGQRTLLVTDEQDRELRLPADYLDAGYVTHGYAVTGHKAQGLTTEHAWVLGSDEVFREWGYVALSRGRAANRLYVVGDDRDVETDAHHHGEAARGRDAVAELVRVLERSRGQALALDAGHVPVPAKTAGGGDQRREALRGLLASAPTDPKRELAAVVEERDAALDQLAAAEQRRDQAAARLPDVGRGLRGRARREAAEQAQARADHAAANVRRWQARLTGLDQRLACLHAAATTRAAWLHRHAETLDEARGLVAAREHLARRRGQAAEFRTPAYVEVEIGRRPDDPAERRAWRSAVLAVESYRLAYGVDDPDQALGPPPRPGEQRAAYDDARDALRAVGVVRDQLLTHTHQQQELG
jgi:hypothetical protein